MCHHCVGWGSVYVDIDTHIYVTYLLVYYVYVQMTYMDSTSRSSGGAAILPSTVGT